MICFSYSICSATASSMNSESEVDGAGLGLATLHVALGDPEVDDLHFPRIAHQHVVGIDVAMDDAQPVADHVLGGVRIGEAVAQAADHFDDVRRVERLALLARQID